MELYPSPVHVHRPVLLLVGRHHDERVAVAQRGRDALPGEVDEQQFGGERQRQRGEPLEPRPRLGHRRVGQSGPDAGEGGVRVQDMNPNSVTPEPNSINQSINLFF